jgi:hypothetical protein
MTEPQPLQEDVERILAALGSPLPRRRRPVLVLIAGLPGTGKSAFAAQVAARTPLVVLESDALRRLIFPRPRYSAAESRRLFAAVHAAVDHLLSRGTPCLLDATNITETHRRPLYDIADARGAKLVIAEAVAPRGIVYQRLRDRAREGGVGSDADIFVYARMRPQREEISREHFTVDTSQDVTPAAEEVARAVQDP